MRTAKSFAIRIFSGWMPFMFMAAYLLGEAGRKIKSALLVFPILLLIGCGVHQPITPVVPPLPSTYDWTISISWDYDFTNFVQCSTTVTKGCIASFTWGYTANGTDFPVKTLTAPVPACSTTILTSCFTGTTGLLHFKDTGNSTLGIGTVTYFAKANAVLNDGTLGSSSDATFTDPTAVAIGLVQNVAATKQ
jgi:hypothetical protein